MNDPPSSPRNRAEALVDEQFVASTDRAILLLSENAERQRCEELEEKRLVSERLMQAISDTQDHQDQMVNREPYDSAESESGYESVTNRSLMRIASAQLKIWERVRDRDRNAQQRKEREQKEEDKRELDAMFHILLHDDDDFLMTDSIDYEFRLPEFMLLDEIKRGFDEQMKKEPEEREEAESREKETEAASSNDINSQPSTSAVSTDWCMEGYHRDKYENVKYEEIPFETEDIDLANYISMDEDDEEPDKSTCDIIERAVKRTISNREASTNSGMWSSSDSSCVSSKSLVFIVHASDSE